MGSTILIVLITLTTVLSLTATAVIGIICLFQNDEKQKQSATSLIIASSLFVASVFSLFYLLSINQDIKREEIKDEPFDSALKDAEVEPFFAEQYPGLKPLFENGVFFVKPAAVYASAERRMISIAKIVPDSDLVKAKMMLLETQANLPSYEWAAQPDSDSFAELIEKLCGKQGNSETDSDAGLKLKEPDVIKQIDKNLSDDWYRTVAHKLTYKFFDDREALKKLDEELKARANKKITENIYSTASDLLMAISGLVVTMAALFNARNFLKTRTYIPPPLKLKAVYGVFLAFTVSYLCTDIGIILYSSFTKTHGTADFNATSYTLHVCSMLVGALAAVAFFIARFQQENVLHILRLSITRANFWRSLKIGVCGYAASCFTNTVAAAVGEQFLFTTAPSNLSLDVSASTSTLNLLNTLGYFLALSVLGPLTEEIVFRGVIFNWLRNHLGVILSALLSGLLFAAMHCSPERMVELTISGFIFAIVYEKAENLTAPVVAHALNNAIWLFWILIDGKH